MNGEVIKLGIHIIASLGVSKVLSDIVVNNTTVTTTTDAILVKTGTLVLGTMIAGHAKDHVSDTIDKAVMLFKKKDDGEDNEPLVIPDPPDSDYRQDTSS